MVGPLLKRSGTTAHRQPSPGARCAIRKAELMEQQRLCPPASGSLTVPLPDVRRRPSPDRRLAAQLHQRGVPIRGGGERADSGRRAPSGAPRRCSPLGIIRSLAYFSPVIEEVLNSSRESKYCPLSAPAHRNLHLSPIALFGHSRCGVDDADCSVPSFLRSPTSCAPTGGRRSAPRLDPALSLGHSNQSLLGHF